jgi:hypothetical protein
MFMIREGDKLLEPQEWFKQGLDRLTPEQKKEFLAKAQAALLTPRPKGPKEPNSQK